MASIRNQFSKWNSTKVKARYDYTCAECGSTENIQAHDPTEKHTDWRDGIALCGKCHSKKHPNVPEKLFSIKGHQPYWPNVSARTLARGFGCHNRTIIRRAKALNIPAGTPLSNEDEQRILLYKTPLKRLRYNDNPSEVGDIRRKLRMTQQELADRIGVDRVTVARWEIGETEPSQLARLELAKLV